MTAGTLSSAFADDSTASFSCVCGRQLLTVQGLCSCATLATNGILYCLSPRVSVDCPNWEPGRSSLTSSLHAVDCGYMYLVESPVTSNMLDDTDDASALQ